MGDIENSRSAGDEFVYITSLNGEKAAASSSGYLVSDALNEYDLSEGDCALVDYKVNFENQNGSKIYPDYLIIDPLNIFRASTHFRATTSYAPYENTTKNDVITSVKVYAYSPDSYLAGRWLFDVDYRKYEGEEAPQLQVFYDPNNQPEGDAERGFITLDMALSRVGGVSGNAEPLPASMKSVVNFSGLRSLLENRALEDPEYKNVFILNFRFRYPVPTTTTDKPEEIEKGYKLAITPTVSSYRLIYDYRENNQ
jgi:hypothetical protein